MIRILPTQFFQPDQKPVSFASLVPKPLSLVGPEPGKWGWDCPHKVLKLFSLILRKKGSPLVVLCSAKKCFTMYFRTRFSITVYKSFGYQKLSQRQYVLLLWWSGTVATVLRPFKSVVRKCISPRINFRLYSAFRIKDLCTHCYRWSFHGGAVLHLGPVFHWSQQRPRLPVSAVFRHSVAHSAQRQADGLPKCKTINFNLHVTKPFPSFIEENFSPFKWHATDWINWSCSFNQLVIFDSSTVSERGEKLRNCMQKVLGGNHCIFVWCCV